MKVRVRMFAAARQLAGSDAVEVELDDGRTVGDLRRKLALAIPSLAPLVPHLMFAIGSNYADDGAAIAPRADVACFPPVSGG